MSVPMVLWWIGNVVLLLVVVPLVVLLAQRAVRSGREIEAYAADIVVHGVAVSGNLDPVPALVDTRQLVHVATGHAVRYAAALKPLV